MVKGLDLSTAHVREASVEVRVEKFWLVSLKSVFRCLSGKMRTIPRNFVHIS